MKKKGLTIIFIIIAIMNMMSCNNVQKNRGIENIITSDYNEDDFTNIINLIPEVQSLDKSIRYSSHNKRGVSILNSDSDNDSTILLRVGDNNEVRFQTYYRFLVDKKTNDIYVIGNDDELLLLMDWSKTNGIQKEYKSITDSIKYEDYLSQHYLNIPNELDGYPIINKASSISNDLLTNLPFSFDDYFQWQLKIDMSEIDDDGSYPKNYLEDNKPFQEAYFSYFGKDTIPNYYIKFNTDENFDLMLMISADINKPILYYKIITFNGSNIVNQFTIYTLESDHLSVNFDISKLLQIKKYSRGTINSEYQIDNDGRIKKVN